MTYPVDVVSYSLLPGEADWTAHDITAILHKDEGVKGIDGSTFVVQFRKQLWGEVMTRLPGVHNVANCLGAIAVSHALGLPADRVRQAISEFRGAGRRFEFVGEAAGVTVMDDYAHHPTEVRATLAAAREHFPGRRIVALFQPHTYTRTTYLLDEFRTCFADCDSLFIAETYAAREDPSAGLDAEALTREVTSPRAVYAGSVADAAKAVARSLRRGDVFFTIGAGDIDKAGPAILQLLASTDARNE